MYFLTYSYKRTGQRKKTANRSQNQVYCSVLDFFPLKITAMESAWNAESKMIAAMSQQKNVNEQNKMASYFERNPPCGRLLDANFEEVRKSNSSGFKKKTVVYMENTYKYSMKYMLSI